MKKIFNNILCYLYFSICLALFSCNGYLDNIPKGEKIPTTFIDYDAFINYSDQLYMEIDYPCMLMDEFFKSSSKLSSDPLSKVMCLWDENADRTIINSVDYAYKRAYEGVFYWNLIVQNGMSVTGCSDVERRALVAQGRVLRDITYFYLATYYADQYSNTTLDKLSIPLVTSPDMEALSPQVTIRELFNFLVEDLTKAIPDLPISSSNMYHPIKAAGYGMLARVYLTMGNYELALKNANEALNLNNKLYNWINYYNADKSRFDSPTNYTTSVPLGIDDPEQLNCENYVFRHSSMMFYNGNYGSGNYALSPERAARFEKGDTRLLTHWKVRSSTSLGTYYYGIYAVEPNKGGIRSAEMYYIKAECLARTGKIAEGMNTLNEVRKTRILPEYYKDLTADSEQEAVEKITNDKFNEFIQNIISYSDRRRLNKDPLYSKTMTRVVGGTTYTLSPDSHLWIMPFPEDVIKNPGNSPIVQNVDK